MSTLLATIRRLGPLATLTVVLLSAVAHAQPTTCLCPGMMGPGTTCPGMTGPGTAGRGVISGLGLATWAIGLLLAMAVMGVLVALMVYLFRLARSFREPT